MPPVASTRQSLLVSNGNENSQSINKSNNYDLNINSNELNNNGDNNNNNDINSIDDTTNISTSTPICDKFGFIIDETSKAKSNLRNFHNSTSEADVVVKNNEEIIKKLKKREQKWLAMLRDSKTWNKLVSNDYETVRRRCRKGIPSSVKGLAWFHLAGAHISMQKYPKFYEKLEPEPGDEQVCDDIRKDIHRQFPNHELFREADGQGQKTLFNILKCFAIVRKEISYCQGLAPLASILIMQMPPAHAFWVLLSITDHYIPSYYMSGFQAIQQHGKMLFKLLKKYAPIAYKIFKKGDIDPVLVMFEWFMCLFVRNLPWPSVLRVFDMFLCEGVVVIFKTAIIIIESTITKDFKKKDQHEILEALKNVPKKKLQENVLIPQVINHKLTDNELKKEHKRQMRKQTKRDR